jgi:methionine aminopeptidase
MDYLNLILGVLFSTSEILPYIKSIKGNGIFDILYNIIKNVKKGQPLIDIENPIEETTENIIENPFQFKTPEEYQMIYIDTNLRNNLMKNFIIKNIDNNIKHKLEFVGFKVDYNIDTDNYVIHW